MYENANLLSPITPYQSGKTQLYSYKFFPKLMDNLMLDECEVAEIEWPTNKQERDIRKKGYDIFNPEVNYTLENIDAMTWIVCSLSSYWYHQHSEKVAHVTWWVAQMIKLMKSNEESHLAMIMQQAIETMRMFGDYVTIASNMSYFIQSVEPFKHYKPDWKCMNKLKIAFKYLDLGTNYDFENIMVKSKIGDNDS